MMATNDIDYKRWSCHSGYKLLCNLCRNLPSFGQTCHADLMGGWRCSSCCGIPSSTILILLVHVINVKKDQFPYYTDWGSSDSSILIFGRVLADAGSGVNKVTDDFGANIKSAFSHKNRDISDK